MNPTILLWPIALHALVTLGLYLPMSRARIRSVREGRAEASVYKLNRDEPEESLRFTNAIRNQNETGILFYAACLTAYVTDGASFLTAALAWLFLILKTVHVAVHATTNRVRRRRPLFMVAYFTLILFWLVIVAHLAGIA